MLKKNTACVDTSSWELSPTLQIHDCYNTLAGFMC